MNRVIVYCLVSFGSRALRREEKFVVPLGYQTQISRYQSPCRLSCPDCCWVCLLIESEHFQSFSLPETVRSVQQRNVRFEKSSVPVKWWAVEHYNHVGGGRCVRNTVGSVEGTRIIRHDTCERSEL